MTDLTQTIADAAEKYSQYEWDEYQEHLRIGGNKLHVRSFVKLGFTAGANLIVGMLDIAETNLADLRSSYSAAVTRYYELDAKFKIATDALESICDRRCAEGLNPCEARKALGEISK